MNRKVYRTNRVEHHGGSRRGDAPERETCSNTTVRLDCKMDGFSFAGIGPILDALTKGNANDGTERRV